MKDTDLMIGDWVEYQTINEFHYYGQIEDVAKGGYVCLDIENGIWETETKDIKPIPLTSEILEKNGWVKKCGYMRCIFEPENKINSSLDWSPLFPLYVEQDWSYCLPSPKYVHELQHALHLCGLEELRMNFKI